MIAGLAHVPLLSSVANFLLVEEPLRPAAAIVALNAGMPAREIEAARLYHAGWAPMIVLVRGTHLAHSKELQDLGLPIEEARKIGRDILDRFGVPLSEIRILKDEPSGTHGELQTIARAVHPNDAPVSLVTSKFHGRRTRLPGCM